MAKVSASLLSADFSLAEKWLPLLERARPDFIHWDFMDKVYVPNDGVERNRFFEFGPLTKIPFDVHFMVEKPETLVPKFLERAEMVSFHLETTEKAKDIIELIHGSNAKAGIAVNVTEPIEWVEPFFEEVDFFLVMSVEAGFGGQKFIEASLGKVAFLARKREQLGLKFEIEIDGGINSETAERAVDAGTDILVSGSRLFKAASIEEAVSSLKGI